MSTTKQPKTTKSPACKAGEPAKRQPRKAAVRKPAVEPVQALPVPAPAKTSKRDQLAALLVRDEGATIEQMIAATSWLPHTVRAALTGLRKRGYAIDSDKVDGLRIYRGLAPR